MEKNLFWFPIPDQQSPNTLNSLGSLFNTEQQNSVPAYMKPYSNEFFPNGSLPSYTFTGLPQSRVSQPNETPNWFYCLPRFRQAFASSLNSMPKERLPAGTVENVGGHENVAFGNHCAQKRFLVFDQSGDQTTLIYSSEIVSPVPRLNSWNPKPPAGHNWLTEKLGIDIDRISPLGPRLGPFLNDEYEDGNQKDDAESEMHEDTEELNALLYSDDDDDDDDNDYSEDDEETSTGHSPSTMTAHRIQEWFEEKDEEVASSAGSTKRQKLLDGGYNIPSVMDTALMDTASSLKCAAHSELEDDAESSCGKGSQVRREFSSFSCKKRSRKQNIHETIRILQSIIPDGKGKDAMDIIDEAIHYLRSLKGKAKDLGLDTL